MNEYVKSDLLRYYGQADNKTFWKAYFENNIFRFQVAFRLAKSEAALEKIIGRILWKLNRTKKIIQIPLEVQVGYGLYIAHDAPIIVNPTAVIGNNCSLSHFLTIGANDGVAAVIGDNTYIGPNVCIVEDVKIGSNVTIGAGSVVTKDIPDNATAAGNYAKVLHYNYAGRYV